MAAERLMCLTDEYDINFIIGRLGLIISDSIQARIYLLFCTLLPTSSK